jgi:hypothetical protein
LHLLYYSEKIEKLNGGSAWESNPPERLLTPHTGFEVREDHQCPIHFRKKVANEKQALILIGVDLENNSLL